MWQTKLSIRKSIFKQFNSIKNRINIYLPSLTHGVQWNKTLFLSASNQYKTLNNEGLFVNTFEKQDNNTFNVLCNNFINGNQTLSYNLFKMLNDGTTVNYEPTEELLKGIKLELSRPAILYIYFGILTIPGGTTTKLGFNILCNGKSVFNNTFPNSLVFAENVQSGGLIGQALFLQTVYIQPDISNGGIAFVQFEKLHNFICTNAPLTGALCVIDYTDVTQESPTENTIQILAYEEK